jgi:hypothetical protein
MSGSPNIANQKSLSSVLNGPATMAESMRASASNSINSLTNSIKSLNSNISAPLQESISSVSSTGPGIVIIPIIIGIGVLIIALTLIIVYRSDIEAGFISAYNYLANHFSSSKNTTQEQQLQEQQKKEHEEHIQSQNRPPPLEHSPLTYPPQQQDPPKSTLDVVNKMIPGGKQVFNVSANKYTYNDAEPLCKALGAELATYDQVKQAWDDGADWCNYGWVKGQAAIYPTQKSTFDELQGGGNDDERLACGTPGINGGYFDNPELRFGVNCYGDKPAQTSNDLRITNTHNNPPLGPDGLKRKNKELAYKAQIDTIGLLPFRANTWSE